MEVPCELDLPACEAADSKLTMPGIPVAENILRTAGWFYSYLAIFVSVCLSVCQSGEAWEGVSWHESLI